MRLDVSNKVKLTPAQMVLWEQSLTAFSWHACAFTSLMYDILNPDKDRMVATFLGTKGIPKWFLAGTNSKRLFLCAERYFKLQLLEQVFLNAHEVCHPMLGHIIAGTYYSQKGYIEHGFKKMKYIPMLANIAQDYIINDMLIESKIGKMPKGGLHDPKIATYKDSWIDVYEKLYDEQGGGGGGQGTPCEDGEEGDGDEGNSGGSSEQESKDDDDKEAKPKKSKAKPKDGEGEDEQPRERNGQQGFDGHLEYGEGEPKPGAGADEEGEAETETGEVGDYEPPTLTEEDLHREMQRVQQATAAAMELARARGKLPEALRQFCEKLLEPVVDWTEHVKALFARKLGTGGYDFRRPDRRFLVRDIIVPGRSGYGANLVIIGGDSSGSIYAVPQLTDRWMAECGGMVEDVNPREVHTVWCDAEIHRVDVLEDITDVHKMVHKGTIGGGGTDFRPVFAYAESLNQDIDCLLFLTDGDGVFPDHPPKFPVIWGDISGNRSKYPFGDVVHIPVPAKALNNFRRNK